MTSYAPNYTSRYRAHYKVAGIEHTAQLRKQLGATPADTANLAGTMSAIFTVWATKLCNDFVWLGAEQADENSDIFYPSTTPVAVTGTVGAASTFTPFQKITHTRFSCRALGSRSGIEMYGILWYYADVGGDPNTYPYDGIVTSVEDSRVTDTIVLLNTQAFANSGNPSSTWNPRATVKVNDYWLRQLRKGAVS